MKKLLFLSGILLFSCQKESQVGKRVNSDSVDSVIQETDDRQPDSTVVTDSAAANLGVSEVGERRGMSREVSGNQIIRTANASQLPFRIGEEFNEEGQEFVLKIQDFEKGKISAEVIPEHQDQNIRINQIKLPNGEFDGPFGRDLIDYEVKDNGEVWLIFARSPMASGSSAGRFSVSVK